MFGVADGVVEEEQGKKIQNEILGNHAGFEDMTST